MIEKLSSCKICPHNCGVNRLEGKIGRCRCDDKLKIALASIHYYEEPCISGTKGSGTVFFSNCNLRCRYCQNYEISQLQKGKEISVEHLANIFLNQQQKKAHNINLVTPTSYVYHIIEALDIAKKQGLSIPVIYNTNGYENIETIQLLKGYVDVYLPDLKYYSNELAKKYSGVEHYFEVATKAIQEMYKQVGGVTCNEEGMVQKGVMLRHLVLPNHILNTKHILRWIKDNLPQDISVSVMAQYFPTYKAKEDLLLNRKLTKKEYRQVEEYLYSLDLENGYIQELGEYEEEYVPEFDFSE